LIIVEFFHWTESKSGGDDELECVVHVGTDRIIGAPAGPYIGELLVGPLSQ
jgi:hypothetical protein